MKYQCDQDNFLLIMLFIFFGVLYVFGVAVRADTADRRVWLMQGLDNGYWLQYMLFHIKWCFTITQMSCQYEYDMFLIAVFGIVLGALYVFERVPNRNENDIDVWDGNLD